jgi:hypothetical protein
MDWIIDGGMLRCGKRALEHGSGHHHGAHEECEPVDGPFQLREVTVHPLVRMCEREVEYDEERDGSTCTTRG